MSNDIDDVAMTYHWLKIYDNIIPNFFRYQFRIRRAYNMYRRVKRYFFLSTSAIKTLRGEGKNSNGGERGYFILQKALSKAKEK